MEPGTAFGLAWYRRSDYRRIIEVMADGDRLAPTFGEWEKAAEQAEAQVKARGGIPIRAYINPEEFVAWCAANGMDVDAKARTRWGAEAAYRAIKGQH